MSRALAYGTQALRDSFEDFTFYVRGPIPERLEAARARVLEGRLDAAELGRLHRVLWDFRGAPIEFKADASTAEKSAAAAAAAELLLDALDLKGPGPTSPLGDAELANAARLLAEERGELPRRFRFARLGSIQARRVEWLVRGFVPADGLTAIFGEPGSFKSFVLASLAVSVAGGVPFFGQPVRPGPVALMVGEGRTGFVLRLRAAAIDAGLDPDALPIYVSESAARLGDPEFTAEALDAMAAIEREAGGVPVLLGIDTWASQLVGDENAAQDVGEALRQIAIAAPGCARVVVHHSPLGEARLRGSSALRGALDASFSTVRAKDGRMTLSCAKMKDAAEPEARGFELRMVELPGVLDEEGAPVRAGVLAEAEGVASPEPQAAIPKGRNLTKGLELLRELYSTCAANLERAGRDPASARPGLAHWRSACIDAGMNRARFAEVRDGLLKAGLIVVDGEHVLPVLVPGTASVRPSELGSFGPPIRTDVSDASCPTDSASDSDGFGRIRTESGFDNMGNLSRIAEPVADRRPRRRPKPGEVVATWEDLGAEEARG